MANEHTDYQSLCWIDVLRYGVPALLPGEGVDRFGASCDDRCLVILPPESRTPVDPGGLHVGGSRRYPLCLVKNSRLSWERDPPSSQYRSFRPSTPAVSSSYYQRRRT